MKYKAFLFGLAVGLYADMTLALRPDQPLPRCETKREAKRWNNDYRALTPEQQAWLLKEHHWAGKHDWNHDGTLDAIVIDSTPSTRHCDLANRWEEKENLITITDGKTGKKRMFYWQGNLVASVQYKNKTWSSVEINFSGVMNNRPLTK